MEMEYYQPKHLKIHFSTIGLKYFSFIVMDPVIKDIENRQFNTKGQIFISEEPVMLCNIFYS